MSLRSQAVLGVPLVKAAFPDRAVAPEQYAEQ
jgi:hypothetical protein